MKKLLYDILSRLMIFGGGVVLSYLHHPTLAVICFVIFILSFIL